MIPRERAGHSESSLWVSKSPAILMLLAAVLALGGLWPEAVFGCGGSSDVTNVDVWAGSTQSDAESYNTADFWKCPGQTFGWYVEWDADEPDDDDFNGEIYVGSTLVDTFTADEDEREDSGTATVPSSMSGGIYSVECWMQRDGGEWESDTATAQIKVVEVELEFVGRGDASCTLLSARKLCTNAQNCYKKTKWKAKKVRPSGTTASLSSTGVAAVTFSSDVPGWSQTAVSEGDMFWVEKTGTTGNYQITLTHNDYGNCPDTDGDIVFEFEFEFNKYDATGASTPPEAMYDEAGRYVSASKTAPPIGLEVGAWLREDHKMKVVTNPTGAYSGNVNAKADITFKTDGHITIYKPQLPANWDSPSVTLDFGIISVTYPGSPGTVDYGSAMAGADISSEIAGCVPPIEELGEISYTHEDVTVPPGELFWYGIWPTGPDLTQARLDRLRTYAVGSTEVDTKFKICVSCEITDYIFRIWQRSPCVTFNLQIFDTIEAEDSDGVYEIVP